VKLFIDEDTGARLGRALEAVGADAWYVGPAKRNRIKTGTWDEDWIPIVSSNGRLILSRNTQMLDSPLERQLLIDNRAAIVFLPAHLTALALLQLVMKKWAWLESVFDNEPRPFAYRLTATGFPVPVDLASYIPRRPRGKRSPSLEDPPPAVAPPDPPWEQTELPLI
jgi:hypothetical protein